MLLDYLSQVPDHRRRQGQRYPLKEILLIAILAILSGATSYRDMARFIKGRLKSLKTLFGLKWKGAPSKSILREIFCGIDKSVLEKTFRNYSRGLAMTEKTKPEHSQGFAIDGKALKGSFDHVKGNEILHLLSVFCTNNQLILGHVEIPEKTNEIPTAQALIKELALPPGSVYTLDAMHCQKKHSKRLKK